jgi:hypothetical protein
MNAHDEDRMKKLLQQALPPVDADTEPDRDLWPAVLRKMKSEPIAPPLFSCAWFDWALLAALVAFVAFLPQSIPVLLYYL